MARTRTWLQIKQMRGMKKRRKSMMMADSCNSTKRVYTKTKTWPIRGRCKIRRVTTQTLMVYRRDRITRFGCFLQKWRTFRGNNKSTTNGSIHQLLAIMCRQTDCVERVRMSGHAQSRVVSEVTVDLLSKVRVLWAWTWGFHLAWSSIITRLREVGIDQLGFILS